MADFGNWAEGRYRIPGPSVETEQEQGGAALPEADGDSE